jgi:hypothetical protein
MEGLDISLSESLFQEESAPMLQLKIPLSLEDSLRAFEAEMDYIEALAPPISAKNENSTGHVEFYQKTMMQLHAAYQATSRHRTPTGGCNSRRSLSAGDKDEASVDVGHASCDRLASFLSTREEQSQSTESASALRLSFAIDAPECVATPGTQKKMLNIEETTSGANYTDSFFDHMRGRAVKRISFLTTLDARTRSSSLGEHPRRPSNISIMASSMGSSTDEVLSTIVQLEIPGPADDNSSLSVLQVCFDKVAGFRQGRKSASKKHAKTTTM